MDTRLKKIKKFIEVFDSRRVKRDEKRIEVIGNFIKNFSDFNRISNRPIDCNMFKLLKLNDDEVKNSAILTWLLNPRANYYENKIFFDAFLKSCGIDLSFDRIDNYSVRTEFPGMESIVDLLIYKKGTFIIYVENKINAQEGIDQCTRELRDLHRLGNRLKVQMDKQFAIFLTPDGRKPESGDHKHWRTLSYVELSTTFRQLIPEIKSEKIRYVLEDWLEIVSNF